MGNFPFWTNLTSAGKPLVFGLVPTKSISTCKIEQATKNKNPVAWDPDFMWWNMISSYFPSSLGP